MSKLHRFGSSGSSWVTEGKEDEGGSLTLPLCLEWWVYQALNGERSKLIFHEIPQLMEKSIIFVLLIPDAVGCQTVELDGVIRHARCVLA